MWKILHREAAPQTQPILHDSPRARWRLLIVLLGGLGWWALVYQSLRLPDVREWLYTDPASTAYMEAAAAIPIRQWVPLARIAPGLQRAVVVAEDDKFFEHDGFDWGAIWQAVAVNWQRQKFSRGASTITQQVARNLYLSPSKNIFRKLKEALITLRLEQELPKERILELYLNIAQWGPGIYGAEAASQFYFHQPAQSLGSAQAAFLASILPNPVGLGKRGFRMNYRARLILRRM